MTTVTDSGVAARSLTRGSVSESDEMAAAETPAGPRPWRFFRAGGFDQVRLDSGADIARIDQLDQKLWVALACPVTGLEFDAKTLQLIDTDKDGRIRAPEIIAACKWACAMLRDPDQLLKSEPALPLSQINDSTPEGKQVLASARQILMNLGRADADAITIDDTTDTARIFAQTRFNGDGIIPPDAAGDDALARGVLEEIVKAYPTLADRSGKAGVDAKTVERFFADLQSFSDWQARAEADAATILPLGEATGAAADALGAVRSKVDDYFARCRLAAYDPRSTGALNRQESDYLAIAAADLTITSKEIAVLPLSRVEACRPLPFDGQVNPAWAEAVTKLREHVVRPLLGEKESLTEAEWATLKARFAAHEAWLGARPPTPADGVGVSRAREILASGARAAIADLLARDKALEPEASAIAAVDRLVRYHRDLYKLLNNFVSFRDFYRRTEKAVFQAGTLYLDQRSCELCIRVEDPARHGTMAHLSQAYLAYCDLTRKATGQKMTVACAFTAGDADNLMVGRNGIFYDRQGNDWDATITKIVDNPISIRQAFWAPYKRAIRWVEDQVAKRAAAADAAAHQDVTKSIEKSFTAPAPAPAAKPGEPKKMDVGVVAALGVAVGALTTAAGMFLQWLTGAGYLIPVYVALVMLAISLPSMVIAALKLRLRNLGPILDANGWAVNARARINIPFGRVLTRTRALPPGAKRSLTDPYADTHVTRNTLLIVAAAAAVAWALWYFGGIERVAPGVFPKSGWVERIEQDRKNEADRKEAEARAAAAGAGPAAAATPAAPAASPAPATPGPTP